MHKVDLLIPTSRKDVSKLEFVVPAAVKNVAGATSVHIVTPEPRLVQGTDFGVGVPVYIHGDDNVVGVDRAKIKHRPNWIFQMFVELFQQVTGEWWVCLDADLVLTRKINPFKGGKPNFILDRVDQYHEPYFAFNKKILGFGKVSKKSFLSEMAVYSMAYIDALVSYCGCETRGDLIDKMVSAIEPFACYPAESEFFGSYMYKVHPGEYKMSRYKFRMNGKYEGEWDRAEMEKTIGLSNDVHGVTLHSWRW